MKTLTDFKNKIYEIGVDNLQLLVTATKLPTNCIEVITNYQKLDTKFEYLINAYDENLKLKANQDIQMLDFIVL